jgi:uncharacterized protein YecE (DUF72 family)
MEGKYLVITICATIHVLRKNWLHWQKKLKKIRDMSDNSFVYFSNFYAGKSIVNALQFKEIVANAPLKEIEKY